MCCIHPSRYQVTTIRECSNHVLQLQCCNHLQHRLRPDPGPGGSDSAAQAKVAPSLWRLRRQPPAPVPVLRRCHWSFQVRVTTSLMSRRRARAGPERLQARGPSPADSGRRTRTRSRPPVRHSNRGSPGLINIVGLGWPWPPRGLAGLFQADHRRGLIEADLDAALQVTARIAPSSPALGGGAAR